MVLSAAGVEQALTEVLTDVLGEPSLRVAGLQRLSGGASRETWSFDAHTGSGSAMRCVLRRDPLGARRHAGADMATETELLRAAAAAAVPVPAVIASGDANSALGAPFIVMERIDGETIGRRILRDPALAGARAALVAQCAEAAARIHAIDLDSAPSLRPQEPLAAYRTILEATGEPHPVFELAFRWLEAHRPIPRPAAVVHGDFRLGNLIVDGDGLRAVLDWELAHLGNPVEDLGWLCVRSWRFGAPQRVAGVGDADELLAGYRHAGGAAVAEDELTWWEVMGTLRWGIICIVQAATHLSGTLRSVELAAIGRRVCEVEWDLLLLLDPLLRR